jgi:hypothetical protein
MHSRRYHHRFWKHTEGHLSLFTCPLATNGRSSLPWRARPGRDGRQTPGTPYHGRHLWSGRVEALVCRLYCATVGVCVIDEDRGARVELVPHLRDFGRERDLVETIVSPFAVG